MLLLFLILPESKDEGYLANSEPEVGMALENLDLNLNLRLSWYVASNKWLNPPEAWLCYLKRKTHVLSSQHCHRMKQAISMIA